MRAEASNNRRKKWLIPELVWFFMFSTSSHVLLLHFRQGNYFWYFPGMCRNNFTTVSATTVLRAVCGLFVSVWRRQLYVRDMFLFPLPLSFEHASVAVIWVLQLQLDKWHCHCSPFSPFFFFPEDSLRHAYSNTTEDANNQFFTPHICDRRCVTCKIPCEVCVVVHGTDLRTVTLCEYLWTGLLSVLTKTL